MDKIYLNEVAASQIRECLRRKGVTQEVFASTQLESTFRTLQNWLSGKTPISISKLDIIQRYCCISIEKLFGEVPISYPREVGGITVLLRKILAIDFLLAIRKYYQDYISWLLSCVHFNPYPVNGYFRVLEHNASIERDFYNEFSIHAKSNKVPVGAEFAIGYILLAGGIRVNYGWMTVKEKYIEVREAFTQSSIVYTIPIDFSNFEKSGIIFYIITWFGKESCSFVIHSLSEEFFVNNLGKVEMSDSDVLKSKFNEKVVFQKCMGHSLSY